MRLFRAFNRLFPLWAIGLALLAVFWPEPFTRLSGRIPGLLALVMFAMGLTLSGRDFVRVASSPRSVLAGVALQFTLMPLAALGVSRLLGLDVRLITGMVLVGASAGGTASNVIAWLAGGRVAVSVSMTLVFTLASVVLTPLIVWFLVGASVEVRVGTMLLSILTIVCAPVLLGVAAHHWLGERIRPLEPALAVVLHNALGLAGGYGLSRLLGFDRRTARTLAV